MSGPVFPIPRETSLLVIDVQERLLPAMPEAERERLVHMIGVLVELAFVYERPCFYSEQYPKGLGKTVPKLLMGLEAAGATYMAKTEFSLCRNPAYETDFEPTLTHDVVVVGMETHVCVLQTVVDLVGRGHNVFVPWDGVLSRDPRNKRNGLDLIRKAGAVETNIESLLFHAFGKAGGEHFKRFSKLIR